MFKLTILLLAVCLFNGCALSDTSKTGGRDAFWGRRIEADGTEYLRIGSSQFKTRSKKSR
jgi:hypothetical protein